MSNESPASENPIDSRMTGSTYYHDALLVLMGLAAFAGVMGYLRLTAKEWNRREVKMRLDAEVSAERARITAIYAAQQEAAMAMYEVVMPEGEQPDE